MRYITVLTVLGKEYTTKNSDISDIDLSCDIISVEYCNGKVVDINRDQIESITKESGFNYIASPCKILDSINDELKYLEENINIDVARVWDGQSADMILKHKEYLEWLQQAMKDASKLASQLDDFIYPNEQEIHDHLMRKDGKIVSRY